jgi:NADH-quinone oxidoreductase subunit C
MDAASIHQHLKAKFPQGVGDCHLDVKDPWIAIEPAAIAEVSRFLHDDEETRFDFLANQSAVDWKDRQIIQVVYHLFSYPKRHYIVLKVDLARDNPVVPTVEPIWKVADWLEREIYDLMGVIFEGHPDLRRLLMPEDWIGHPARKDFVEPPEYHGISTRRESLLR